MFKALYGALHSVGAHIEDQADVTSLGAHEAFPGDADYGIKPEDDIVSIRYPLTASRTWHLPPPNSVPPGKTIWLRDGGGVNTLQAPFGPFYIDIIGNLSGAGTFFGPSPLFLSTFRLAVPGSSFYVISDGVTTWQVLGNVNSILSFAHFLPITTLATGANTGANFTNPGGPAVGSSYIRLTSGPVGPFSIGGIQNGYSDLVLYIINDTGQALTWNHIDGGAAFGNQIKTATGANIATIAGSTVSILVYNSDTLYWQLVTPTA